MKKLLIIALLFWGCPSEPEDCAGVSGGTAVEDKCGTCDNDSANDCVQDCAGEWGGISSEDCNGVCGGDSITDCDGNCFEYYYVILIDDGQCQDGAFGGLNFHCPDFDCDGGDCGQVLEDGACVDACDEGGYDCFGKCFMEFGQPFWPIGHNGPWTEGDPWKIGDGYCDDGYPSVFSFACEEFECDGGDCLDECGNCCCSGYLCDESGSQTEVPCGPAGVDPIGPTCGEGDVSCDCDGNCVDCAY